MAKTKTCLIRLALNTNDHPRLHFQNLDIIRFAAAFYVLLHHTFSYLFDVYHLPAFMLKSGGQKLPDDLLPALVPLHQFISNGPLGVDLFFLISGFLITSLLIHEKSIHERVDIKSFYLRRILRIWPLYYFIIVFAYLFAHYYTGEPFFRKDIYPHLFFVSNFTQIAANSWCAGKLFMLWSLCIEEQFYLVIPLLLALVPVKKLPYVFIGFVLLSIGIRMQLFHVYQYPWFAIYLHTGSRFDTLAIGCLLGYLNYAGFKFSFGPVVRILLGLWLVAALSFINSIYYDSFMAAVFYKYVFIIPMALLFLDLMQNVLPGLKNPFWQLINKLGKYSYGIYMYQVFLIVVADRWAGDYFSKSRWAFIAISFTITIVVSVLSYEIFEKHFLKLKKRFEKV